MTMWISVHQLEEMAVGSLLPSWITVLISSLHGATEQEIEMQEQQQGQSNVALISFVRPCLFTSHGADKKEERTEAKRGCVSFYCEP